MTILKDFDLDTIRKARARRAASGGVDLVTGLRNISPEIEKLQPGQTAKLPVGGDANDKNRFRKAVMNITAKLNNITVQGAEWEGRVYRVVSDGEDSVYVQRGDDLARKDIRARPVRTGRKPNAAKAGQTTSAKNGALVTENA
jgi:hypothetical protein